MFHVIHIGYPDYDPNLGLIQQFNTDISCEDMTCAVESCNPACLHKAGLEQQTRPQHR